jgi:hypothetical protein
MGSRHKQIAPYNFSLFTSSKKAFAQQTMKKMKRSDGRKDL